MIDPKVLKIAQEFAARWSLGGDKAPLLKLDFSWPSVGVLDLLTFHLRTKEELEVDDAVLVKGVSSYLAVIAYQCWSTFGVQISVGEAPQGIVIKAQAEDGKELLLVAIEKAVARILKEVPMSFPVICYLERDVLPDHNFLSLLGIGLMTGLCPFSEGVWANDTPQSKRENIDHAVRILAKTSAEYYGRVFSEEPLGQVAELYLGQLIYPPTMIDEELPAQNAISGLGSFIAEYQVSMKQALQLAQNLARTPDEIFSGAGLSLYAALVDGVPSPEVIAVSHDKGGYPGLLRAAMNKARDIFQLRSDWIYQPEFVAEDERRFDLEVMLNFLPWVRLPKKRCRNAQTRPLLQALALFDWDESIKLLDRQIAEAPGDIEFRLQRIYLDLARGDSEKAESELRKLVSEPGAERDTTLVHLWGLSELTLGKTELAVTHLKAAHNLGPSEVVKSAELANNYAWALIVAEKYEQALPLLDDAIKNDPAPVTAYLNKAYVCRILGREDEAKICDERLLLLAPTDHRVFRNLMLTS